MLKLQENLVIYLRHGQESAILGASINLCCFCEMKNKLPSLSWTTVAVTCGKKARIYRCILTLLIASLCINY